jgi:Flp pilus assembly protein CpaB
VSQWGGLTTAEAGGRMTAPSPTVLRRRPLPGGRALAGGLLVAVAVVGVFAAYTDATAGPSRSYVVARRDLAPGTRLSAGDLAVRAVDLPGEQAGRAFRDVSSLEGAVLVGPVGAGELLQAGAVVRGDAVGHEVSFPVARARALGGRLAPGERVDVVATYGTGADAVTVAVVRRALVVDVGGSRGPLGDQGDLVLTLSVGDPTEAMALAHAAGAGELTVVRTTGAGPASGPDTYQPFAEAP